MNRDNKKEKLIPELRFKKFKEEWKQLHLKDIANLKSGGTPSTKIPSYWQGNIPWVSSADISEDDINNIKISRYISEEAIKHSATHLIPAESILVVSRVGVGKMAINNVPITTSQDFQSVILNKPTTDIHFLVYPLKAQVKKSLGHNQGTSIRGILKEDLENISINLPSLPEQQKISSFLSLIDKKIELLNKKKELLEIYKKGIMHNIFNRDIRFKDSNGNDYPEWEEKRLGEVCERISNGTSQIQNDTKTGNMVTRIETISSGDIDLSKVGFVNNLINPSKYKLHLGDILFSNINSPTQIGRSVYIDKDIQLYHGMNLLRISFNTDINSEFIYYYLNLEQMRNYFQRMCNKAVNQASINQTDLAKTKLFIPSIQEQNKITKIIHINKEKIIKMNSYIKELSTFKIGLLQKMFT